VLGAPGCPEGVPGAADGDQGAGEVHADDRAVSRRR
jgi:hypothetical protein